MPMHDLRVYAGYSREWYWIKVDPNGGELPLSGTMSTYFWESYGELVEEYTVTRDYVEDPSGDYRYHYAEFNENDPDGPQYATRRAWYDTQMGTVNGVPDDGKSYRLSGPGEGYVFAGWYEVHEDGSMTPYNFSSVVTHNLIIKALWKQQGNFRVYYSTDRALDANGNEIEGLSVAPGQTAPIDTFRYAENANIIVQSGGVAADDEEYVFAGWYFGNQVLAAGNVFTADPDLASLHPLETDGTPDTFVLYPVYIKVGGSTEPTTTRTSLVLDANGGSKDGSFTAPENSQWLTDDQLELAWDEMPTNGSVDLPEGNIYLRDKYEFLGWAFSRDAKTPAFVAGQRVGVDNLPGSGYQGDNTNVLYAVWRRQEVPVRLKKVDADQNNAPLSGAAFDFITDPSGDTQVSLSSGEDGWLKDAGGVSLFTLKTPAASGAVYEYALTETQTPLKYVTLENASVKVAYDGTVSFSMNGEDLDAQEDADGTAVVLVPNHRRSAQVTVTKTVSGGEEGERFGFTASLTEDGAVLPGYPILPGKKTNSSGQATFTLSDGDVMTLTVPAGADLIVAETENTRYEAQVTCGDDTETSNQWSGTVYDNTSVLFTNTRLTGTLTFTKVNLSGEPLPGAAFTLYSDPACETIAATAQSGQDGAVAFDPLPTGTYYMKETAVPEGYLDNGDIYEVHIEKTGSAIYLYENGAITGQALENIVNRRKTRLLWIMKLADDTGEALPGAAFTLTQTDGEDFNPLTLTTGEDGWAGESPIELPFGVYTLRETGVPAYYQAVQDVTLTVSEDGISAGGTALPLMGETHVLTLVDQRLTASLTLIKQVTGSDADMRSAYGFTLTSGEESLHLTLCGVTDDSAEEPLRDRIVFPDVPQGLTLSISETAQADFDTEITIALSDGTSQTLTGPDTGNITITGDTTVTYTNTRRVQHIRFQKIGDDAPDGLPGAVFTLTGPDGEEINLTSSADEDALGLLAAENGDTEFALSAGTYTLTETQSPEYYQGMGSVTFTVTPQGVTSDGLPQGALLTGNTSVGWIFTLPNTRKTARITVTKSVTGLDGDKAVPFAFTASLDGEEEAFTLYGDEAREHEKVFEDVPFGTWLGVTEDLGDDPDYEMTLTAVDGDGAPIEPDAETGLYRVNAEEITFTVVNTRLRQDVTVRKVDGDGRIIPTGASFALYRAEEYGQEGAEPVSTGTTGQDGLLSLGKVPTGSYLLAETAPPPGYMGLTSPARVTVLHDRVTSTQGTVSSEAALTDGAFVIDVVNTTGYTLPSTGGPGTGLIYALGAALTLSALATLLMKLKRREE